MAATAAQIREVILEELRSKGYAPNPADVTGAAHKIAAMLESALVDAAASEVVKVEAAATTPTPSLEPKPTGATPPKS